MLCDHKMHMRSKNEYINSHISTSNKRSKFCRLSCRKVPDIAGGLLVNFLLVIEVVAARISTLEHA